MLTYIDRLRAAGESGTMVKRNLSFLLLFWLGRGAGIFLLCCEPLLIAFLLWSWTTSTLLEKATVLFFLVWGFFLALSMLRVPRQRLRVESLRMRMNEAPLYEKQPAYDQAALCVPVTLTVRLSAGTCQVFTMFWLLMLAVVLIFQTSFFLALQILWWVVGGWLLLGALVLAAFAVGFYQRIEVSEDALLVQHGWLRRRVPWGEARLFAILNLEEPARSSTHRVVPERERARLYELSSAHTILRWVHEGGGPAFVSSPRDREEYRRLLEELRAYIRIKTGLMVLDLR
jgi:hypothetical protein